MPHKAQHKKICAIFRIIILVCKNTMQKYNYFFILQNFDKIYNLHYSQKIASLRHCGHDPQSPINKEIAGHARNDALDYTIYKEAYE